MEAGAKPPVGLCVQRRKERTRNIVTGGGRGRGETILCTNCCLLLDEERQAKSTPSQDVIQQTLLCHR